jgi:hypothetical protein
MSISRIESAIRSGSRSRSREGHRRANGRRRPFKDKLHEVILRARMERAQEGLFDPRCAIPASLLKPKPVLLRESGTDDMTAEGDSFPPDVAQKLKTYVYRLIDPRNAETFYVGKGRGRK